jgi:thiamine biosynthesis lipoprotein
MMGMHVTVEVREGDEGRGCDLVFGYLRYIDETFSTYKPDSEISKINRGELAEHQYSPDIREIFKLAEQTKQETHGYFDIRKPDGTRDPSGIVKGWAIWQAGLLLEREGYSYFFIDAGGDIQGHVANQQNQTWRVGIRNPFKREEIIKVLQTTNEGVATSGTYERGQHIYDPHEPAKLISGIVSLTVIGPNVYEADRFATAAFAMGSAGISFIESLPGLEGYVVDAEGTATMTSGFGKYVTS